ncbi:angiotensin-converting enzyme-like isoform X3 [Branchiostoma floridae]|uniref:Angiotensin-converting enzyme n=1 Tax=Branchiostoma floridae TaxID=7739 RepID=A0A9J7HGN9_BRAFL|nr:angiotensin-converting enzyme-like isoform X3 [Branchiostoma floridae]
MWNVWKIWLCFGAVLLSCSGYTWPLPDQLSAAQQRELKELQEDVETEISDICCNNGLKRCCVETKKSLAERKIEEWKELIDSLKELKSTPDEEKAMKWLEEYNEELRQRQAKSAEANWAQSTNITDENAAKVVDVTMELTKWSLKKMEEGKKFDTSGFSDDVKRQFGMITKSGSSSDEEKTRKVAEIGTELEKIYSTSTACLPSGTCLKLDPDLEGILAKSRDYDRLTWAWLSWRDAVGPPMKDKYAEWVALMNEGAQENGYADKGVIWRGAYEMPNDTLEEMVDGVWEKVKPLYTQLHAYVRRKLSETYGEDKVLTTGHIPAHLFGNMWAQQWNNIYDIVVPFPDQPAIDVSDTMVEQGYDPLRMFKTAEAFFVSIGLRPMPQTFWDKSMITRPDDREVVCHGSAWDFYHLPGDTDVRIKMCTKVNQEDLQTIHHEMGHIEYFLTYEDQKTLYRGGANPGFHEAVGDTIALSVNTPGHLKKIGLLQNIEGNQGTEFQINELLKMALSKVAFLPFGLLIDKWRWRVFSGDITPDKFNTEWWNLRMKYQGIKPPVERTDEDFDPGAKYHIPSGTPYIRYFFSFVAQFQFQQALCEEAGHDGPLHTCDIYQSKKAGAKLKNMLSMGESKPWPEAMKAITGQDKLDPSAILKYFEPLEKWLREQNKNEELGWE